MTIERNVTGVAAAMKIVGRLDTTTAPALDKTINDDISGTKDKQVWEVNVEGTKKVVAACKKMGVKTLIYVSSVDAIPLGNGNELITEPSSFDPDAVEGAYSKSKATASQYVLDNADESLKVEEGSIEFKNVTVYNEEDGFYHLGDKDGYVIFDGANGFFIGYKQDYAGGYGVVMILNTVGKYLCTLINGSWTTNTINIS